MIDTDLTDAKKLLLQQRLKKSLGQVARADAPAAAQRPVAAAVPAAARARNAAHLAGSWDAVVAAAHTAASSVYPAEAQALYASRLVQLDALCAGLVGAALRRLGFFAEGESPLDAPALATRHGIAPHYAAALGRLLRIGAQAGWLREEGGAWSRCAGWPDEPGDAEVLALRAGFGELPELFDFIVRSGRALPEILTGRQHAAEMLFPEGRLDIAERLYTQSPPFRYCNAVAAAVVRQLAQTLPRDALFSLAEIGAGTGATTLAVLPALEGRASDYLFSDISNFFIDLARHRFADRAFVRYGLLDIEKSGGAEAGERFDVIVAAHVLHATRDIDATLRNVRSLLADGGLLILLEETAMHRFFCLTMGLQTGFDRFEDAPLRTEHPLLSASQWEAALRRSGFVRTLALPELLGIQPLLAQVERSA